MIHSITNEETGEVFTFTEEQLRLMLKHAPDEQTKAFVQNRILVGNHLELSSGDFYVLCYLATRTWLGVKGENGRPS